MQPYSFVAAKEEEQYFIIDTHVISSELGGNGNGILKVFKQSSAVARWIWKRISNSGVKPSEIQEIVAIQWNDDFPNKEKFEPDGLKSEQNQPQTREPMTVDEEDKKHSAARETEVDCFGTDGIGLSKENRTDIFPDISQEKSNSTHDNKYSCNTVEMDHWGPYKLPYLPSYCRKLTNSEVLELIKSNRKRAIRIPQACRRNAVF